MKAKDKPAFCYFDRTSSIENISDEDAVKMGLFSTTEGTKMNGIIFEFFGDIQYDPMTGKMLSGDAVCTTGTLSEFQDTIMGRALANE